MFKVIIREYIEKEQEQIFASVIKPRTFYVNFVPYRLCSTNTFGNTLKEDTQRENHASVMKPSAFAANFGFQYEMLWFDSFRYPSK